MAQASPVTHFNALREIRDRAYLLSLGNVYLCEDVFLRKIGNEIDPLLDRFVEDTLTIKRKFPGQLAGDVGIDAAVENLRSISKELKNPDPGLGDKCTAGELGRELEKAVGALNLALRALIAKVEGDLPEYSTKDAVLDALSAAKTPAKVVSSTMALMLKGVVLVLVLALGPLAYLVLSMDTEAKLRKEISGSEARISSIEERIESLERERAGVIKEIEALKADNPAREERISAIELNMRVHGLDDKLSQAEVELTNLEELRDGKLARIERIKNKSFLQRLLDR